MTTAATSSDPASAPPPEPSQSAPAGEGEAGSLSGPTPSPADNEPTEHDDDETVDGELDENGEPIRNVAAHQASREAAKYRKERNAERQRADSAVAEASELRMQNAFLIAAVGKVNDLDAAWKLADLTAVQVSDDGAITGLDDVIKTTVERYPYLSPADDDDPEPFVPLPTEPSGRPTNGRANSGDAAQRTSTLQAKFPALRHLPPGRR